MSKEQILENLLRKRQVLAPVANIEHQINSKRQEIYTLAPKYVKVMMGLGIFGLICLAGPDKGVALLFFGIAGAIFYFKNQKMNELRGESSALYSQLAKLQANPNYKAESEGFPKKFYNYHDVNRLYYLIEEGRALELREAFNLLENQQYKETQLDIQNEMRNLQKDIANSSRVTAVSSVITAINTRKD